MRDLQLYEQLLLRLRQEKSQQLHVTARDATGPDQLPAIKALAHEAEQLSRLLAALKVLEKDSGTFIKEYLL
jgi:hypothetical protein